MENPNSLLVVTFKQTTLLEAVWIDRCIDEIMNSNFKKVICFMQAGRKIMDWFCYKLF